MNRESVVTLIFLCVIYAAIVLIIGQYFCADEEYFWRFVSFIGLGLDAIGAFWLVIFEIQEVQKSVSTDLTTLHDQLDEATFEHDDAHSEWLVPGDVGFSQLQNIARDRISMANPQEKEDEVDIEYFTHWPSGKIYARGSNGNQVTLGTPQKVRRWVLEEVSSRVERRGRLYAVILLSVGFAMQLYSHYVQFL